MKISSNLIIALFIFFSFSCQKETKQGNETNSVIHNSPATNKFVLEEAFPGQKGIVKEGYLFGKPINYQVINGKNVFAGDIILPGKLISNSPPLIDGAVIGDNNNRWPNHIVPFTIDPGFPDVFRITDAIADWEAHTPFRFIPRTGEADFVTFIPTGFGGGIFSAGVGRVGGQQIIGISTEAVTGNVTHEIGHAVGLFHEHQRVDRNNSIIINFNNIQSGFAHNFLTYSQLNVNGFDAEPFDFGSIMMYPSFAFADNPLIPTITRLDGSIFATQRIGLSPHDMDVATTLTGFTQWVNLGGNLSSKPIAISRSNHSVNVFGRGTSNQLMHRYWNGSSWNNWEDLGGNFQGAPAASRRGTTIVDVFVRGTNNHLLHRYWQNNAWSNWTDLGGNISSSPASISRDGSTINIYARGPNNELLTIWWSGSAWSGWQNLGGNITLEPSVSSRGTNSIDVFCRGNNNQLMQRSWDGSTWLSWIDLGGQLASSPTSVSWSSNRIDLYYRANSGLLEHRSWQPDSGWRIDPFGGLLTFGDAAVTSQKYNSLNLFSLNNANQLMHKWYE